MWGFKANVEKALTTILVRLGSINDKVERIMATNAEFAQALVDLKAQLVKAAAEIVAKIAALEDAIANSGNSTPEMDAALADAKAAAQALDDINPDAPTP